MLSRPHFIHLRRARSPLNSCGGSKATCYVVEAEFHIMPAFISEAQNQEVGIRGRSRCHGSAPGPARWCCRKRGRVRLPYVDLCQFRQSYV